MRSEPTFKYLLDFNDTISAVYNFFNLGQPFDHFLSVANQLREEGVNIVAKLPRFFSDTRFANYSHLVFESFLENYPALIRAIVEVQEEGTRQDATENQKKKADRCAGLQVLIYSLQFVLMLSGLCDIYKHYSNSVNVLQIVNILPHEKYDRFEEDCRGKLRLMLTKIEPADCGCLTERQEGGEEGAGGAREEGADGAREEGAGEAREEGADGAREEGAGGATEEGADGAREEGAGGAREEGAGGSREEEEDGGTDKDDDKCKWPLLHKHLKEWQDQKQVRGVNLGFLEADQVRPGLRSGTQEVLETHQVKEDRTLKTVMGRCRDVVEYIETGLGEVYSPEDLEMMEHIRTVLDLKKYLGEVKDLGSAGAAQKTTLKFMQAAEFIDPDIRIRCSRTEMRAQHQEFSRKLAEIVKMKDSEKLESMEIMVLLMETDGKRYEGCEVILDVLCQAAAMKSIESVVESWISVLEPGVLILYGGSTLAGDHFSKSNLAAILHNFKTCQTRGLFYIFRIFS